MGNLFIFFFLKEAIYMLDLIGAAYNLDVYIFYAINSGLNNTFFNILMPIIANLGLYSFWILICILLAIFGGEKGRNVALICFVAIVVGYFSAEILKIIFARPRPFEVLAGVNLFGMETEYSFPSTHATEVFIGCTIIGKKYGHLIPLICLAMLVSISRVYLGVHYPSDILGGALLGLGISFSILHYEDHILKLKNRLVHR